MASVQRSRRADKPLEAKQGKHTRWTNTNDQRKRKNQATSHDKQSQKQPHSKANQPVIPECTGPPVAPHQRSLVALPHPGGHQRGRIRPLLAAHPAGVWAARRRGVGSKENPSAGVGCCPVSSVFSVAQSPVLPGVECSNVSQTEVGGGMRQQLRECQMRGVRDPVSS